MSRFERLVATLFACLSTGALATNIPSFTVTGVIGTSEPHSCDGGGSTGDLTVSQLLTWTQCHAWKRHMDTSGTAILANTFDPNALRPLSVTVDVDAWCLYQNNTAGDIGPISTQRTQTGLNGRFSVTIPQWACGIPSLPASGVIVRVTALLQYEMDDALGHAGTIRAIWDRTLGATVYSSGLPPEPSAYTDAYGDWIIPRFILDQSTVGIPAAAGTTLDIGKQFFFLGAVPTYYNYLRGAFGTWENVITLHRKLLAELSADGHGALYRRMFVNSAGGCAACYTLGFNNPSGGGAGLPGGFSIDQPVSSPPQWLYGGLVSVGLPAHEFGHSMHGGIATGSFGAYDDSMFATMDASGGINAFHMGYVDGTTLQQQEMLLAFMEGFGNAMGIYFMNGCVIADRGWGDPDPLHAMWNPAAFTSCDANDIFCPYRAFRYQMIERGIAEGSATWNARLTSLTDLATQASLAGAVNVTSNNELKIRNFFCDLLDGQKSLSFATGQIKGRTYIADYLWHAAERLDGRTPPVTFARYASDPKADKAQISLGTLLVAMDNFLPNLHAWPPVYPLPLWQLPALVDGANAAYNSVRLSVNGPFAPQALGLYLVNTHAVKKKELNEILRANRMEELP